ncbi:hypothetical protein GCM10023092_07660 [Rurimicrobium arvi]|uniref:Glycosyltransferase RgtA/B/C/D-like domain-containing protein n=1 Tax=Rurimicrobium arvi TaxID=2049916 RepID=A0ABP8MKG9_9BACT
MVILADCKFILKKSLLAVLLFAIATLTADFLQERWKSDPLTKWDGSGYYLYLPATFIYHDLLEMKFYDSLDKEYKFSPGFNGQYALYPQPATGRLLNKYALGTALGEMPLFFVADYWCTHVDSHYKADGYSPPYQMAIVFSNVLWSIIGLLILAFPLRRLFSDTVTALCLLGIGMGTNLLVYSTIDMGMSHAWMFLLVSGVIFFTEKLYRTSSRGSAVGLGLFLGLVFISRPVDALILLVPLTWPLQQRGNLRARLAFWRNHLSQLLLVMLAGLAASSPLLLYWKATSGHWLHFSYEEERFIFTDPQIIKGLFSYQKGWFVYTPLAFIACLGMFLHRKERRSLMLPVYWFLPLFIYVVFSWQHWSYGWGFGARPMIDALPVVAIALAAILEWALQKNIFTRALITMMLGFCIWLNIYQTFQYYNGTIHGYLMNKEYYWRIWNRMHVGDEDRKLLG